MLLAFLRQIPLKSPIPRSVLSLTSTSTSTSTVRFFGTQSPKINSLPYERTAAYYDNLVNAAARDRDFDTLRRLLNKRVREHCFNTKNTFRFITNTDASLSVLDDLIKTLARLDNGFPRSSACDALIARLCKLGRVDQSLRIVRMMEREKYGLSVFTFYPILSSLTRKKKMEEAWRIIEMMKEAGVSPDITALNYLLTAYCCIGDITGADGVMKRIKEEGLSADSRTVDSLVLGACRIGKVEGALALLRRMEEDKVQVLYCTHAHIINALVKEGYYAQAVKFVMIYGEREEGLNQETFGLLASKLIKIKRSEEAKLVLEEMVKKGLVMGDKLQHYCNLNVKSVK